MQPVGHGLQIGASDGLAVLPAQQVLQQDFQRHRQLVEVAEGLGRLRQAEILVGLGADYEAAAAVEAV
ncbi:hypothetical protein D3C80_2061940 [compost metagenome]